MKPTEVARQLGVSRSWLYHAAKTGRIPSIRIGGDDGPLRFVSEDIERWIDDARTAWKPGRSTLATQTLAVMHGQRTRSYSQRGSAASSAAIVASAPGRSRRLDA